MNIGVVNIALRWASALLAGCICLPLMLATTGYAQYRFDQWTIDNGMPNNTVWALTQTRDGYLWMATASGLVRFDGVRLMVFEKSNNPGITSNRFTVLHEDQEGDLWAGTEDGGC